MLYVWWESWFCRQWHQQYMYIHIHRKGNDLYMLYIYICVRNDFCNSFQLPQLLMATQLPLVVVYICDAELFLRRIWWRIKWMEVHTHISIYASTHFFLPRYLCLHFDRVESNWSFCKRKLHFDYHQSIEGIETDIYTMIKKDR